MSSVSRHHYCGKALQNLGLYSAPMFFEQIDTSCKTGYLILQSQWKNLPNFIAFLLLAMDTEQTYFNKGQKEIQSWLFVWLRVFVLFLKIIFQSYLYVLIINAGLQMQKSMRGYGAPNLLCHGSNRAFGSGAVTPYSNTLGYWIPNIPHASHKLYLLSHRGGKKQ